MRINFGFERRFYIVIALTFLLLAACSQATTQITPTPSPTVLLIPYRTATPTQPIDPAGGAGILLPTATPYIYVVVAGDTLFTIAARLEISLEGLMAANPSVDPRLLSPGMELIIPIAGSSTAVPAIPSPTPAPMHLSEPRCFASAAGELWCLVLVQNDNEYGLENITAIVQLLSAGGDVLANVEAVPPLNVLPAGEAMPLVAYLTEPPNGWATASGQLLSAYALAQGNSYYLDAELHDTDVDISPDGLSARALGQVQIAGDAAFGELWVLAVAYDADGEVVGVRRWESDGDTEFNFWVYSLGPEIAEVSLLVEARPRAISVPTAPE